MANANAASKFILPARPNPAVGRTKNARNSNHGPQSSIFQELALRTKDFDYWREDFIAANASEAIGSTKVFQYAESNVGATDPAKVTPTSADPSAILLATTANSYNQTLVGPKMFEADKGPFIEVRFKLDTVTKSKLFIGFVDALPASAAVVVSDIDTPAFDAGVADAAAFGFDLGQTLTTAALVTIGTSTAAGKTAAPTAAPYGIPTAATYVRYRVEIRGDLAGGVSRAYAFVDDQLVAERAGPDGTKLLAPFLFVGAAVDTTGVNTTIDYIEIGAQKPGSPF